MNEEPKRFEDEFPKAAAFLMELYRQPRFTCEQGHLHFLPYRIHIGKDNSWKRPLHP